MSSKLPPSPFPSSETILLPPPTPETKVAAALDEATVLLWRGTSPEQAAAIEKHKTAGGVERLDHEEDPGRPSEEQAKAQAVGYSLPGFKPADRLPEYTTRQGIARQFSPTIVCIAILKKYLTKGSGAEDGWVALPNAPIVAALVHSGKGTAYTGPNAD